MRGAVLSAMTCLAIWVSATSPVLACKCVPPDLRRDYDTAEVALHVRVLGQVPAPAGQRRYLALSLGKALKGCMPPLALVLLQSAADSAACGVSFELGSEQLVFGSQQGRRFGLPLLATSSCQGNRAYAELSADEHGFLDTRYSCCGAACGCVASPLVQCLADPCAVSSCGVDGATCTANYCGGCGAEWHDASGARVCETGSASCDDPDRSYVARSAEACQTVRFTCVAGTDAFSDACGCGCVTQHPSVVQPCRIGGCSGELCLAPDDANTITPCVFRPEFACYRSATCAPQANGACGFTETPELAACIAAASTTATP